MLSNVCDHFSCPECGQPFYHLVPLGDTCPDMKGTVRKCEPCCSAPTLPFPDQSVTVTLL